mgnify:CR=1 FL=1
MMEVIRLINFKIFFRFSLDVAFIICYIIATK